MENQKNNHLSTSFENDDFCDVSDDVKNIVNELLIDKDSINNIAIEEYLIENKESFEWTTKVKKDYLYDDRIEVDFTECPMLDNFDINDPLVRVVLMNIIRKVYWINDSKFHEVHYWEKEGTFCVFHYKDEVKRYNQYSEEAMQSLLDKFIWDLDLFWIVSARIDSEFILENYTQEELKIFYEWWYKDKIYEIIKNEIYNNLHKLLHKNLEDKVIMWMVQYFYRAYFDDVNDLMLKKFNSLLVDNIEWLLDEDKTTNLKIESSVAKKITTFNSNEMIVNSELNTKTAEYVFENGIKDMINFINDDKSKLPDNKIDHPIKKNDNLIRDVIFELMWDFWIKVLDEYASEKMWIKMDKWLLKSMVFNNAFKRWDGSMIFELSKMIMKYIADCYRDSEQSKIMLWFESFVNNFNWMLSKSWFEKPFWSFAMKYFNELEPWDGYWRHFMMQYWKLMSLSEMRIRRKHDWVWYNYDVKSEHTKENIIMALQWISNIEVAAHFSWDWKYVVSDFEYYYYHLIKEFSWHLLKWCK